MIKKQYVIWFVLSLILFLFVVSGCSYVVNRTGYGMKSSGSASDTLKLVDYSQSLSPGYPQSILPVVPGANIKDTKHSTCGPYTISATVDSINQAASFYDKFLKNKGKQTNTSYSNVGETSGWSYNVSAKKDKNTVLLNIALSQILDPTQAKIKASLSGG